MLCLKFSTPTEFDFNAERFCSGEVPKVSSGSTMSMSRVLSMSSIVQVSTKFLGENCTSKLAAWKETCNLFLFCKTLSLQVELLPLKYHSLFLHLNHPELEGNGEVGS